jgi:hypothetical protein
MKIKYYSGTIYLKTKNKHAKHPSVFKLNYKNIYIHKYLKILKYITFRLLGYKELLCGQLLNLYTR